MTVSLNRDCNRIDWAELESLFTAADLGGRLIAAAHAINDYEYHSMIYNVAVHPEFQRMGIGSQLMTDLLKRLPVWRTALVCDGDNQEFYTQLGFAPFDKVMARFDRDQLTDG